jgi:hypothetical protein
MNTDTLIDTLKAPEIAGPSGCVVCGAPKTVRVGWPPPSLRAILTEKEWDGRVVKVEACDRHAAHPLRWPASVCAPLWERMRPVPA